MTRLRLTAWLIGHTRQLLPPLVVSVLARIANQLLAVALLTVTAAALGQAATGWAVSVPSVIGWLAGLAIAKAGLRYLEHYAGHWVAFTALQRLRELFFTRLIPQAPAATTGRAGAELTERATRDIDRIEVFFAHALPPAASALVVPAVTLTWLGVAVDGLLAAVTAPFVAIALLLPAWSSPATGRAARHVATVRGALAARVGDDIQGTREVLAFGAQHARLRDLDDTGRALTSAREHAAVIRAQRTMTIVLLQMCSLIVPLAIGTMAGLPPTETAVALAVAVGLWGPVRGVEGFASGLDTAFAATDRIRQIIDAEPTIRDSDYPGPVPQHSGVELRGVTARHPGSDQPTLRELSARFAPGRWAFVTGVSGSGKSTLAALLARGLDPESGTVHLGGADVRELRIDELRRRVALVSQHPTLLSGTIADNLRLTAPDANEATIVEAITIAALDDWLALLPKGLDTRLRERGVTVSGGQLQRLALARALVHWPEVLVLDEALSQLDAATAHTVRKRLARTRRGLTVIEITHRADLVPDDAAVFVIDRGRVIEAGTARVLRSAAGSFARLEARI